MNFLVDWAYKPTGATARHSSGSGVLTTSSQKDAEEFVLTALGDRCGGKEFVAQLYEVKLTRLELPGAA